ncbi:MAG: hypothetical protein WD851_13785 [Pirellulales bacterium]
MPFGDYDEMSLSMRAGVERFPHNTRSALHCNAPGTHFALLDEPAVAPGE